MNRGFAVGVFLAGLGCQGPRLGPSAPEEAVQVEQVTLAFAAEDRGEATFRLAVENPASTAVELSEVQWELWLEGRRFAAGARLLQQTVPAHAAAVVEVPASLVFRRMELLRGPRHVRVALRGSLMANWGRGKERLLFQRRLDVESQGAPVFGESELQD